MSAEEINKFINDIAFSGATEFVKTYEGKIDKGAMIGHFGLGFYSSFMISTKVEIHSRSWKMTEAEGAFWSCDGSPEYSLVSKKRRTAEPTSFFMSMEIPRNSSRNSKSTNSLKSTPDL